MTTRDVDLLLHRISELHADVQELKELARQTNGRLRRIEIWRAGLEAVERAHSWIRPAVVAFASGAALSALGWVLSTI